MDIRNLIFQEPDSPEPNPVKKMKLKRIAWPWPLMPVVLVGCVLSSRTCGLSKHLATQCFCVFTWTKFFWIFLDGLLYLPRDQACSVRKKKRFEYFQTSQHYMFQNIWRQLVKTLAFFQDLIKECKMIWEHQQSCSECVNFCVGWKYPYIGRVLLGHYNNQRRAAVTQTVRKKP